MRPFFKNLFFITLLVLLVVAGYRFLQLNNLLSLDAVKATDTAQTVAPSHPPDLQMLAMQLIQAQQQTAESLSPDQNQGEAQEQSEDQLSEQQQIESEQINTANRQLFDTDPEQRKIAVEQLSAYPTPESEKLLLGVLQGDVSPAVRSAAAASLGYIKQPAPETLTGLLLALQDEESISQNTLDTLNKFLQQQPADATAYKYLAVELRAALNKKMLSESVRDNLEQLLEEQNIK